MKVNKTLKLLIAISLLSLNSSILKAQADARSQKKTQVSKELKQARMIKSDAVVTKDLSYGSNINWKGENEELKLDIYTPPKNGQKKYPLIVFIHGGAFVKGDKSTAETFARMMVEKKFAVASINYRLGWSQGEKKTDYNPEEASKAVYRALQDTRASLRYLVANADKYNIDTNWIFVSGASAGGVTSLNIAYYNQQNIDEQFPGFSKELGPIDASNSLSNRFTIKAIVPMWGAVNSLSFITKENAIPTLFFHGIQDNVVPYDVKHWFVLDTFPLGYGSKPIYNLLTSYGVPAVAYIDPTAGHGAFTGQFRAEITACFLNKVMKQELQTGYFISHEEIIHNCP